MARKILHLDLDAFFCAVEEQLNPDLKGIAFAVGGRPDQRGVVASCTYAARRYGVRSAMPMSQAVRLCPSLVIVPQSFKAYRETSKKVMARLHNLTPLVEQLSIDEAFLDVTMYPKPAETIARELQADINTELDLPVSLGVASNKMIAKIANDHGKAQAAGDTPPNTITIVPPGEEAAFLAPLPVKALWGVGAKTTDKLHSLGIRTIGELSRWPESDLVSRFGKHGRDLARHAKGIDNRPVQTEHETKSISKETTFSQDVIQAAELKRTLRRLADGVGRQARKAHLSGRTVTIKLRWRDFTTLTRQVTLDNPTDQDEVIYRAALDLFEKNWQGRPVRLIGVGISNFEAPHHQLSLWDNPAEHEQNQRLQSALDDLRDRFGDDMIRRGSDLKGGST